MEEFKKNYLVEKYKDELDEKDLKLFEAGLEQSSEHALSNLIDLDYELKSKKATLLWGILGAFGAHRFYLGDKKLGTIMFNVAAGLNLIAIIMFIVASTIFNGAVASLDIHIDNLNELLQYNSWYWLAISKRIYTAYSIYLVDIIYISITDAFVLAWWIVDILLCLRRRKKINTKLLLSAAFAQPGPDTEKTRNYHTDTQKTMIFYDKFKKELHRNDRERFKTAVYYSIDAGFAPVEKLKLKSKTVTLVLSIFFSVFGVGSFYLGYSKRGKSTIIKNVLLLISALLVGAVMGLLIFLSASNIAVFSTGAYIFSIIYYIIGGYIQLALYAIIGKRCLEEIFYCYDQVRILNGQKIINILSEYSVNRIPYKT